MENDHNEEKGKKVEIRIDNKPYELKPGEYTVAQLKEIASVPSTDDFDELVDGKLKPLQNDDKLNIKGGEQFISHPHGGGSS